MDGITHVALSSATAMERALGVTANNVANANTDGYRAERVSFASHVAAARAQDGTPTAYVLDTGSWVDERSGPLVRTGNPLDVALSGPAAFAYSLPDGQVAYGRDGRLTIGPDGTLSTAAGIPVLDDGGGRIEVPGEGGSVSISGDGTISMDGLGEIARLGLHDMSDLQSYVRVGDGMFVPPDGRAPPPSEQGTTIVQGSVEGSNVAPVLEMTRLVEIQRAYERASTVMTTHDDLSRDAVRRLARPT
ncbi:flagellar hook basal-body protein [Jannaschia sp. Os4]|uniref:flagellar hook basal-body protein n=1 Tax=Jannaschia sp. Os4 TaxID=2807617 RepID=UPI001939E756|nr:flagellar hook basal-body protein [Jannaschia sp. Os4]MBM2575684.1 flagellar hook basal-body protein [Jannaschia sp. Os4]